MAIDNNRDELARLRAWREQRGREQREHGQRGHEHPRREQWARERRDSGAPGWTGQESPLPSWQETVTELLATTAGVGVVFFAIIMLVKFFG